MILGAAADHACGSVLRHLEQARWYPPGGHPPGLFRELPHHSGSILAAAGLHWALNALKVLASPTVRAWGAR